MTAIPVSTNSLSRPGQMQSFTRRLGASVFDGLAGAYSLRIPAGSTYSGPLLRVRRSSNNAEADFRAVLAADANGNRFLDTAALLAFVNVYPFGGASTFIPLFANRATITDVSSITSFTGIMGGLGNQTFNPITATTAVYPITANATVWYGQFDGTFSKAVRVQFVRTGNNFEVHADDARFTNGNQLANIANAATWNAAVVADSNSANGYGLFNVVLGVTGQGFVTTWYEQATGNHAFQTVANRQPRIVINGVLETENGRPAVRFDNHWLFSGPVPFLTAAPVTIIQAIRWITLSAYRSSAGVGNASFTGAGIDAGIGGGANSNLYVGAANIGNVNGSNVPNAQAIVMTAAHSGSVTSGRISGVDSPGTALSFSYNPASGGHMTIGSSRATVTTNAGGGSMRIPETLFVQGPLSSTQVRRIETNQAPAFGITLP
jgi:hypothetical protein